MEWKNYVEKIVLAHRVRLEGWPSEFPLDKNIDNISVKNLQSIVSKVKSEQIRWIQISEDEAREIAGKAPSRPERATRKDKDKPRGSYLKRKRSSDDCVGDEDVEDSDGGYVDIDEEDEEDEEAHRTTLMHDKDVQQPRAKRMRSKTVSSTVAGNAVANSNPASIPSTITGCALKPIESNAAHASTSRHAPTTGPVHLDFDSFPFAGPVYFLPTNPPTPSLLDALNTSPDNSFDDSWALHFPPLPRFDEEPDLMALPTMPSCSSSLSSFTFP